MSPQHSYDSSHRIKHMFFSSTTFSGGRHIFGFFSHSCRVSGITWPTAIYLSIHPSIYLSISPVYLTVYLAIDPSTNQSIYQSIYLSISLSLQDPPNRGVGGTRALAHSIKNVSKNYQNYTTPWKETKPSLSYVWTILCELHLALGKVAFNNRPIAPSKDPDAGSPSTPWCLPCTRTSQTPGANAAHMLHKFVHFRTTPLGMSPRAPLPRSDHTKTSLQLRFELSAGDRGSFMHISDRA